MSVQHFVDCCNAVVFTFCWGEVTREELVHSLAELRMRPEFHATYHQLIDLSQAAKTALDFKDLCGIRLADDPFSNEGRRAFVAPRGSASFGFARMYQSIVNSPRIEVFHSLADAIHWLGLHALVGREGQLTLDTSDIASRMYRRIWKRLKATSYCPEQVGVQGNERRAESVHQHLTSEPRF
jgi:hypothetical protein